MASYIIGVYWGAREESRQVCAVRISKFIESLAIYDDGLSKWFKKMVSRKAPLVELSLDAEGIASLLKTNRRDIGKEVISDLGFNFSVWTGRESGMSASLAITGGAFSPVVRNAVVVSFDSASTPSTELLQNILKAAIAAFDPDDGVVNSRIGADPEPLTLFSYERSKGLASHLRP